MPVAPTSMWPHAMSLSSDRVLLRPHRCDDCMSSSLLNHPPYCDPSCFEDSPSNLDSACGSPMSQRNPSLRRDYATSNITVAGREFGCNICVEYKEAVGFVRPAASSGRSTRDSMGYVVSEEINRPASAPQPHDPSSLPPNPAEWLPLASWSDPNTPDVGDLFEDPCLLMEEKETNKQTDLYELPPADSTSLLASYRDFILYGEQDCFNDLRSPFFKQAFVMPEVQDDDGSISDDDGKCYCGFCKPFLWQDGAEQEEDLWIGENGEVASAA
ncbi:hypothetical protein FOXG_12409 [Fusarium oxysporum f. sp. lycopersici 4287]|uniref:Uncharacterized protein n=1 Tax=Fusarium oxysporum f. sp. lycopersici (strain 4287 / CBS 123668 / FGSC 9935 / NRRL 34936) TaxID=426428 RepID=A0A0J9WS39_FUSO4|nr:hypothetical protein FOXG_12409 [Fusarium oxysporum f. sp. lycopersici 4287]KAJ9412889.1 hypothetical protein QL093DRAFT_2521755 [Fusarium oxysporum]KNB13612.1 hypothetical protein FOXG_12409 [Fusarium oxysporum f. sp. lycopersici 4287]